MCGISGIINFNKKPNKIVAQNISNAILHRGPDFQSSWSNNFGTHNIARLYCRSKRKWKSAILK